MGVALYLVGSVPAAYILVRLVKGVDVRAVGTKNVGALNTFHQIGGWAALLVLVVDTAKGALAVAAPHMGRRSGLGPLPYYTVGGGRP